MDLFLLRNDSGDRSERPEGQGSSHGIVGVNDGENPAKKFVDICYFVLKNTTIDLINMLMSFSS